MNSSEYVDISTIGISNVEVRRASLPARDAIQSYWMAKTDNLPKSSNTLPTQSDVVIIGSGITGISAAYHLVQSLPIGSSVTIAEARSFCSGATGRNGGHLTAVSALAYTDLASNPNHLLQHDQDTATGPQISRINSAVHQILQFEADTAASISKLITDHGAEEAVGYTAGRNWHLCFNSEEVQAFELSLQNAEEGGMQSFVKKVRRVPLEEVRATMDCPVDVIAAYEIPGATLHPRLLVAHIFRLAQHISSKRNIDLCLVTETPVTEVESLSDSGTTGYSSLIRSQDGRQIRARYVVHATNGYASHLIPSLAGPAGIVPTRAQVVAVQPSTQHQRYWPMGISAGGGYEYGHQRPCTALETEAAFIFGGGREYAPHREWGIDDDSTLCPEVSEFLHPWLAETFPHKYGKTPMMEWTGIMGYTNSKDPFVGSRPGHEGHYIAAGYSGHGMTRAFGCAEVVAQMIACAERGERWVCRSTFPRCYLTTSSVNM